MGSKENGYGCACRQQDMVWIGNPKNLFTVQYQIPHRAAADRRQTRDEGKADDIQLCAARHQRACEGKDQNSGIIEQGDKGHFCSSLIPGLMLWPPLMIWICFS